MKGPPDWRQDLPRIDPEENGLLVEDDPETLHAICRDLLLQWQSLTSDTRLGRKPGRKKDVPYGKNKVKAAVAWLVGQYVDAAVPVPVELYHLVHAVVVEPTDRSADADVKAAKRAKKRRARVEALRFGRELRAMGRKPSAYAIAKHLLERLDPRDGKPFLPIAGRTEQTDDPMANAKSTMKAWLADPGFHLNLMLPLAPAGPDGSLAEE